LGPARDFGLIHRLDRPTSGLLVVGLSPEGYDGVRAQFVERTVLKQYITLVQGRPKPREGVIRQSLAVVRAGGRKKAVLSRGRNSKPAVTHYTTLGHNRQAALVRCRIETGRLHQIRAHMAARKCAVVGDREYGPRTAYDARFAAHAGRGAIFLHAGELAFTHPVSGGRLTVRAPLPPVLRAFLDEEGIECPAEWRR
jgi:23S rRNA pseudouridine1911/1915/1917 synthase